jgi:hypothetical protein
MLQCSASAHPEAVATSYKQLRPDAVAANAYCEHMHACMPKRHGINGMSYMSMYSMAVGIKNARAPAVLE